MVSKDWRNKVKDIPEYEDFAIKRVFEISALELVLHRETFLIICLYRIPDINNFEIFCAQLESLLGYIRSNNKNLKKNIVLGGDLNINMLIGNKYSKALLDIVTSYGLHPCFHEPTRISKRSETCIDQIFTSFQIKYAKIIEPGLSDHTAQLIQLNNVVKYQSFKTLTRTFSENNIKEFINKLENENWEPLYNMTLDSSTNSEFVNSIYQKFLLIFMLNFNSEFPKKTVVNGSKNSKKKWLNDEIIQKSMRKRYLFQLKKQYPFDPDLNRDYVECNKTLKKEIQRAKIECNNNSIGKANNVSRATWKIVNYELGKSTVKHSNIVVNMGKEGLKQNAEAANLLNKHFITVTNRLDLKSHAVDALAYSKNYCNTITASLFLGPVTAQEILFAIGKMKNKRSSGWDEIPMFLMKHVGYIIAPHLAYIFDSCLTLGVFPNLLKYSIIKPIQKNNAKTLDDFRPISLLSVFSNILERVILNRLIPFLNKHRVLNVEQFGFRESLSTVDAVMKFTSYIYENLDNKTPVGAIFCDLSKAFDVMDRSILLSKLENYGIRGVAYDVFSSYFENRYQKVQISNQGEIFESEWDSSETGCPQGSVLGPILFLVFMADLPYNTKSIHSKTIQYADDTSVMVKEGSHGSLEANLEESMTNLNVWFDKNGLKMNRNKTLVVKFSLRSSNFDTSSTSDKVKFLGVYIDSTLNFSYHIEAMISKLNSVCFSLKVLTTCVDIKILKKVYFSNFESILTYGLIIWGGTSLENFTRIFKIQKRALRIIVRAHFDDSCKELFKNLKVMTLPSLYIYELIKNFVKHKDLFTDNINNYNTRKKYVVYPSHSTSKFEKSPYYRTCTVINKILSVKREVVIDKSFLRKVKLFLIDNVFYSLNEFYESDTSVITT